MQALVVTPVEQLTRLVFEQIEAFGEKPRANLGARVGLSGVAGLLLGQELADAPETEFPRMGSGTPSVR